MSRSVDILSRLVAFETVTRTPNLALLDYAKDILVAAGAEILSVPYAEDRANLFAVIGPRDAAPIVLSGHTDVVSVEGQAWTKPAFALTAEDGRLYGRGTADMKGFIACALAAAERAGTRELAHPLALALSCDEEVGCLGVRPLVAELARLGVRPQLVIVGEPTSLSVATGHKGKTSLRARARGREGHSALAPLAFNALHLAADFIVALRSVQAEIAEHGHRDGDYDVPYTTVHAGTMSGGVALNIVPNAAAIEFEIRALAEDDPAAIIARLRDEAARIVAAAQDEDAGLDIEVDSTTPGLATPATSEAVAFVKSLTGGNDTIKVAFATEAGLFAEGLAAPAVVCGPGSMRQGHRPDEFVTEADIARCDGMLDRLLDRLAAR